MADLNSHGSRLDEDADEFWSLLVP